MLLAPELTSDGVVVPFRDQNHTRMYSDVRSTAYHPPPYVLNTVPYDEVYGASTGHPLLPFSTDADELQSFDRAVLHVYENESQSSTLLGNSLPREALTQALCG